MTIGKMLAATVALIVGVFAVIGTFAWMFSFNGTDTGEVCIVREGGIFDGRDIKEVRGPGEGPKPIGAWNHQDCLPITERDSNDVLENDPTFPTRDRVQVIADGQALYTLTSDPALVEKFYRKYARKSWGGKDMWEDEGWLNFQRQRLGPILLDTLRQVIGEYDCNSLNNLCAYVQDPEAAVNGKIKDEGENNTQNLNAAAQKITEVFRQKMKDAFGEEYFENVRYQNLRIRFEGPVQERITQAQTLRTEAANAKLEAEKKVAEARGDADRRVEVARGEAEAAEQQERAYRLNPTKRQIDKIIAFCGQDGCDPKVIGGGAGQVITNLGG